MARKKMKIPSRYWQRFLYFFGITPFIRFSLSDLPRGMVIGTDCRILGIPRLKINREAEISIGNKVVLNSDPQGYHTGMSFPVTLFADQPGARIAIGDESRLHGCCIHAWSQITIGKKCLFAAGSQVLDSHGHATEVEFARIRTRVQDRPEAIQIGDYCWIGLGALVFKGVTLGEGCTVAANSVVSSGVYPPYSLIAGSPAKIIRTIPEDEVLPENYNLEDFNLSGKKTFTY
jgi:acetyltransferase-like isoleucine patch superfamily enzyme